MFYVYSGYLSPDNCDQSSGPTYTLREFNTPEQVTEFKRKFEEETRGDYYGQRIFRVIEGKERKVQAIEVVKDWRLV